MSATTAESTVKDQSTGANVPVEGLAITAAPSNPSAGQILRQVVTIGDGGGTAGQYATVSANGQLATQPGGSRARTNRSSNITAGGTAQDLFIAGQAANGFYFANTSTAMMYLRQDGTAATAITGLPVAPGGFFMTGDTDGAPTTKVSVFCATTAMTYFCETF